LESVRSFLGLSVNPRSDILLTPDHP
jgi:hypothetical protein